MTKYQSDLEACKQISMQVDSQAGERALGGAAVGGAIGAVIGGGDLAKKVPELVLLRVWLREGLQVSESGCW